MRRLVILGALGAVSYLIARARIPKLHERMIAKCHGMFEQMAGRAGASGTGGPCEAVAQSACSGAPSSEGVRDVA